MEKTFEKEKHLPMSFQVYRYQLPVLTLRQGLLGRENKTEEELKRDRNETFRKIISSLLEADTEKWKVRFTLQYQSEDQEQYVIIMESLRQKRITYELEQRVVPNQPYVWLAIDTNEKSQVIAVQRGKELAVETVINTLSSLIHKDIEKEGYSLTINPIRRPQSFWEFVKENQGTIKEVCFIISPPNMPQLSQAIGKDVQTFVQSTNGKEGRISAVARKGESLELSESNSRLESIVRFVDDGGGDYFFRRGNKKRKEKPKDRERIIEAAPLEESPPLIKESEGGVLTKIRELFSLGKGE